MTRAKLSSELFLLVLYLNAYFLLAMPYLS